MSSDPVTPLIAVDVGNSRIKLGLFDRAADADGVVEPSRILELPTQDWDSARLTAWLPAGPAWAEWWIASVNRPATAHLTGWIMRQDSTPSGHSAPVRLLNAADLPLDIRVEHPERVGMDRLAAATAASRLRAPRRGALIVDSGSAITVDYVSADGAFLGGAILPGMGLAARALHEFTDLLPLVPLGELSEPPAALGTSTVTAIRSGLYWGAVGAVRELAERLSVGLVPPPELFLTGGAGPHLAWAFANPVRIAPHLVLSGIAMARRA
jgi:type III pantothenate kinase